MTIVLQGPRNRDLEGLRLIMQSGQQIGDNLSGIGDIIRADKLQTAEQDQLGQLANLFSSQAVDSVGGVRGLNNIAGESFSDPNPANVNTSGNGAVGIDPRRLAEANQQVGLANLLRKSGPTTNLQTGIANLLLEDSSPLARETLRGRRADTANTLARTKETRARTQALQGQRPKPQKPVVVRFDQEVEGSTRPIKRSVRVAPEHANDVERIANTYGTVEPDEIFSSLIFSEQDKVDFGPDDLVSSEVALSALPDFVKASVVVKNTPVTEAVDRYFGLWTDEVGKRSSALGFGRNDVLPDPPKEDELFGLKLQAVLSYVDDETSNEIIDILNNNDLKELKAAWQALSGHSD